MTEIVVQGGVFYYAKINYDTFDEVFKVCHSDEFIELESEDGLRYKIQKSAIIGYGETDESVRNDV